jgi:hypothetical protein
MKRLLWGGLPSVFHTPGGDEKGTLAAVEVGELEPARLGPLADEDLHLVFQHLRVRKRGRWVREGFPPCAGAVAEESSANDDWGGGEHAHRHGGIKPAAYSTVAHLGGLTSW